MQHLYEAILGEKNRGYYLAKFALFDQQGSGLKASWNWAAFFFGWTWALYRKMYLWFFVLLGVSFLSDQIGIQGLSATVLLVLWIGFTVYANSLYHNTIKNRIAKAQLTINDESQLLDYLHSKSGVNTWMIWVFALIPIIGIVAAIAIPAFLHH